MRLIILTMLTAALAAAQDPAALAYQAERAIATIETDPQAFAALVDSMRAIEAAPTAKGAQRAAAIVGPVLTDASVQSAGDTFRFGLPMTATVGYLLSGDHLCYVIWQIDSARVRIWAPTSAGGVVEYTGQPISNGYCTVSLAVGALQLLSPNGPRANYAITWSYLNPAVDASRAWLYAFDPQFANGYALWELKANKVIVAP